MFRCAISTTFENRFSTCNCLDEEAFRDLVDAQAKIEAWRVFYNESRQHSSIGYLEPREKRKRLINQGKDGIGEVVLDPSGTENGVRSSERWLPNG